MLRLIDPHLHFFDLEQGDYHWLAEDQLPSWPEKNKLQRNYAAEDLQLAEGMALAGFVHIEAGFDNQQPWREIEWLENQISTPFRSIAYLDITQADCTADLQRLQKFNSVCGIRYILDDRAAELLSAAEVKQNLVVLADAGLIFETQFSIADNAAVSALSLLMADLPQLKVVINHCGMPAALNEQWMQGIMQLAQYPECHIKCSGWEMFSNGPEWSVEEVKPLISFAVRMFGLTRVMLASNFPVSEMGCSYAELWQRYEAMNWKGFERDMLFEQNARRIYGIA